jgi:hypothetical protein
MMPDTQKNTFHTIGQQSSAKSEIAQVGEEQLTIAF